MPLVECIPNFSEGRDQDKIQTIVDAIYDVAEVDILDVSSDSDHNRTVVTFVGEPDAVREAAFQAVKIASKLIDLNHHSGVHPRIGAADVVPFVPLRDASMKTCVVLAHALGEQIAEELNLPVYFYEYAALRPERRNLALVRNESYEKLRGLIQSDPAFAPDRGPKALGTAGAVSIGARGPLVAFNVYLSTEDVNVAKAIARAIRESGGGLPYLKALGLEVDNRAQISMNVIDFQQTSLFDIMERIRQEAKRYHVDVEESEIVGLIPQSALVNTALSYLKLAPYTRELILEQRLGDINDDYREITFK